MSERLLCNIFISGTLFFFVILFGMTMNSLAQVTFERTPGVPDQVVAGKQLWQARNCNDCHPILGIGGYFAQALPQINRWTHGMQVTASHGHSAFFGAFGMVAGVVQTYLNRLVGVDFMTVRTQYASFRMFLVWFFGLAVCLPSLSL